MKGILIILDGLGDLPCKQLGDKTPLEAAETPNLDFFSARGEMGSMHPVRRGFVPESDEAIISIFGNELISSTRGQLEARGTDIKLTRGDLALRTNFATIDSLEKGNVLDRRAGRTLSTYESESLAKSINKISMPFNFVFEPTIQHRGVLVFKGGFSDNISGNDTTYSNGKSGNTPKIVSCRPLDETEVSQYTSNVVNELLRKIYEVLENHPINTERKKKGLMPANYLLVRGAGIEVPKLKLYPNWLSLSYMPLEIGFSRLSGMKISSFEYPKLKGFDSYSNLHEGLKTACNFATKEIKNNLKKTEYVYIHIKETDLPGHDNKPLEKKEMIEYLDKTLFLFLRKFSPPNKIKIVVTGDHSTPCKLKDHSADPVPVLFYPAEERSPRENKFCEREAKKGTLETFTGNELFKKVGFAR